MILIDNLNFWKIGNLTKTPYFNKTQIYILKINCILSKRFFSLIKNWKHDYNKPINHQLQPIKIKHVSKLILQLTEACDEHLIDLTFMFFFFYRRDWLNLITDQYDNVFSVLFSSVWLHRLVLGIWSLAKYDTIVQ